MTPPDLDTPQRRSVSPAPADDGSPARGLMVGLAAATVLWLLIGLIALSIWAVIR